MEHFANHSLDQMGTEGFEKLLKENHTIKTLSLAEQHLKIFGLFFKLHLNKSRLTKTTAF